MINLSNPVDVSQPPGAIPAVPPLAWVECHGDHREHGPRPAQTWEITTEPGGFHRKIRVKSMEHSSINE